MIASQAAWKEPVPLQIPDGMTHALQMHPLAVEALVRRGITDPAQAMAFLDPYHYQPTSPLELPDLEGSVNRLAKAIRSQERISIWGDFDVDGQTAAAILTHTLSTVNANFNVYLPVRARESHGVNQASIKRLIDDGTRLLLTCDTGITAFEAAETCLQHGVDMLITDHHTLPDSLPPAKFVVNPQRLPSGHRLSSLCGAGTAYQVAGELLRRFSREEESEKLLDLVALGTIADLAALTGDNRYLVQRGLQVMRDNPRPALRAMLALSSVNPAQLNEGHLSFILAPRLNALGRLGDANPIIQFLLSTKKEMIEPLALELDALNAKRKLLCDQVFKAALEKVKRNRELQEDEVLVLDHAGWPAGVNGIVASRLVQLYHRPVLLISTEPGGTGRASARSVEGINITQAIAQNQSLLLGFGGHAMAAGFSLLTENISQFRRAINRTVHQMTVEAPPVAELQLDAYVSLDQITPDLVNSIDQLAPFGPGNPPVLLACRDLLVKSVTTIGKTKEHLQIIVEDTSAKTQKVFWWQGAGFPLPDERFDLAFTARSANFRGQDTFQLEWISTRQAVLSESALKFSTMDIQDFRNMEYPAEKLKEIQNRDSTLVWREGESARDIPGCDRFHLNPADRLVLWSIPPGRSELGAILQQVNPKQVMVFGTMPESDQLQAFINRLAGLVRFRLKESQASVSIQELAVATTQREISVKIGLAWLVAKGFIFTGDLVGNQIELKKGTGIEDAAAARQLEAELSQVLTEVQAFRNYFRKAKLEKLMEE